MMVRHTFIVTFRDGRTERIGAASAAQVRRVYGAEVVTVRRDDPPEPPRNRTHWDIHSGRMPW